MFSTAFLDIPALVSAGGSIDLPGSKSISNRVLLLAALATGTTQVHDLLESDDTRVMLDAIRAIGGKVDRNGRTVSITGIGGVGEQGGVDDGPVRAGFVKLFLGNAGTAMRPLTAALALLGGEFE